MRKIMKKLTTWPVILLILLGLMTITSAQETNPPVAEFSWVAEDLSVNFTDESTDNGTIVAWLWDFGDGNTSSLQNITYTYENEGTYPVNLTVTDDQGLTNSTEKNVTVSITTTPDLTCSIKISPSTLNFKSRGKWITCHIELSDGTNASEINVSSILLNGEVPAEESPTSIGDFDNDSLSDLMVKFKRSDVIDILGIGNETEIIISGQLNDGTSFTSNDTIRTIHTNNTQTQQQNQKAEKQIRNLIRRLIRINPKFEDLIEEILDMLV